MCGSHVWTWAGETCRRNTKRTPLAIGSHVAPLYNFHYILIPIHSNVLSSKYIYLTWARDGRTAAHVRYMYLYMYMHMYMYMHYVHTWTRTFFRASIQKNLNIAYIFELWQSGIIPKKTRAEISHIWACCTRRDLSYETDSGPKTKTDQSVIWGCSVVFV